MRGGVCSAARGRAPRRPSTPAPPLSAFGAQGEKAQRTAAAHDPPPLPPTPGKRAEAQSGCSPRNPRPCPLRAVGGHSGAQGGSPRGTSGWAGRGIEPSPAPPLHGGAPGRPGRSALLGPFCHPQAAPRPGPGPPQVPSGQGQGESPPPGATPVCVRSSSGDCSSNARPGRKRGGVP